MRKFIRHPISMPIEVSAVSQCLDNEAPQLFSLRAGGLAFRSSQIIEPGTLVHIRIPYVLPEFEIVAKVVWCHTHHDETALAVEFLGFDDAFRARMIEQVCHIEDYRREVNQKEGRKLTTHEAAAEWINKFAASFPNPGSETVH